MFLDFYHLHEQPFGVTPDPAYLYSSKTHTETLASLSLGIKENRGFLALIAEPGMGKTTLLYRLMEDLRDDSKSVLLSQTLCNSREFVEYILHDLGVDPQGLSFVAMHGKLNEILFEEMLAGKRFVLIVDEAQNLEDSVLETIRMLSNFETHNTKLLQIVLAGQPKLASLLSQPRLAQLRQRIAVLGHLRPFGPEETAKYIHHRLKMAGYSGDALFEPIFSPNAINLIAHRSQGIPRNINNICYNSLLISCSRGFRTVTSQVVQEAVNQLDVRLLALEQIQLSAFASTPEPPAAHPKESETPAQPPTIPVPKEQPAALKPELTYSEKKRPGLSKWAFRSVILIGGALTAIAIPVILNYAAPKSEKSPISSQDAPSAASIQSTADHSASSGLNFDAEPQDTDAGQVLTVIAGPQQTIKELSLRYAGHFDDTLSSEIRNLNPDLKDFDHLEAGQLIRIPLPPGAMKKGDDVGEDGVPPKPAAPQGFLGKIGGFLRGQK